MHAEKKRVFENRKMNICWYGKMRYTVCGKAPAPGAFLQTCGGKTMAYYILNKGFELRGWDGLPFALRYPNPNFTDFFDKETYRVVYALDGRHDIDEENLSERQKEMLERLKRMKIALPASGKERLDPNQEYLKYPGMYKKSVQWSITGRCNYNCRHCFMSAPDYKGDDLSLEQSIRIVSQLADNGIMGVSITGGEPFVNPHFYEILDAMKARGLKLDTLYSNGKLVNEHLLEELEKRHMHPSFHISFDGVGWHDWLRGEEGAEREAVRAFRLLKDRGYGISTSMCLHKHNINDLRKNINFLAELGLSHVKMNVASATGRWKNETEHFISEDEANEAILSYIPQYVEDGMPVSAQFCGFLDFNREMRVIRVPFMKYSGREGAEKSMACGVVKESMYISPKGKVLPCMTLGGTAIDPQFESILEKDLGDILTKSHYRDICNIRMGECIQHNEKCHDCKYRLACGAGCRACACGECGTDYMAIDEKACHFFLNGWYEKALEIMEKYKDSFPVMEKKEDRPVSLPDDVC